MDSLFHLSVNYGKQFYANGNVIMRKKIMKSQNNGIHYNLEGREGKLGEMLNFSALPSTAVQKKQHVESKISHK